MSGFKNPFEKQPQNPFVDPALSQNQAGYSKLQGLDQDEVPAVRDTGPGWGSGGWGQSSLASNEARYQQAQKSPENKQWAWGQPVQNQSSEVIENPQKVTAEVGKREKELQKRELEYQKREQELKNLQGDMAKQGITVKKKNFPPLIPLVYHSIKEEIPQEKKGLMKKVFISWLGFIFCNFFNFVAVCVGFGGFFAIPWQLCAFALALAYLIIAVPSSFFFWYMRLYNAMRINGTVGYLLYFISGGLAFLYCVYQAVSPEFPGFIPGGNQASAGIWQSIRLFTTSGSGAKVAGAFYIVSFAFWTAESCFFLYVYIRVYRQFRGSGGEKRVQQGAEMVGSLASRMDKV